MPVFNLNDKKGNTILYVGMVFGLTAINRGMPVCLTLQEDALKIQQRFTKNTPVFLEYPQIKSIRELREKELVVKNANAPGDSDKSTVLSMHSVTTNTKSKNSKAKDYILIQYQATSSVVLVFEQIKGTTIGLDAFLEEVKEKACLEDGQE